MNNVKTGAPVAIVTGAADGIGWAVAQRLARDGMRVVIADIQAESAQRRATELGAPHSACAVDVSAEDQVIALVQQAVRQHGRLDVLVNNAGIGEQSAMTLEQTVEAFDRIVAINLRGTFLCSREAGRVMVAQQRGAIVNLASIAGEGGHPGRNGYGAAKAGIATMTAAMASEWARDGVRVNAVAPGYVMTELVRGLIDKGALNAQDICDRTPMGRFAETDEVAEAIAFLASDRASFITGVTLPVDGGWLAFGAPPAKLGSVASRQAGLGGRSV